MLSPCDLVCRRSKCIERDNKIFNLICILRRETAENKEQVRERDAEGELMFSMSSDVMRKVCVGFMKRQAADTRNWVQLLVDKRVSAGVRCVHEMVCQT